MGRASITYSNKDYDSLRQELLARVPLLTDRWTDFNESDLGVVLLELFCGVGDMLVYYLDAQAAEAFLPTARQRQNVINLCKLINYRLDTRSRQRLFCGSAWCRRCRSGDTSTRCRQS